MRFTIFGYSNKFEQQRGDKKMKKIKITYGRAYCDSPWRFAITKRRKYASIERYSVNSGLDARVDNIPLTVFNDIEKKTTKEGVFAYFFEG